MFPSRWSRWNPSPQQGPPRFGATQSAWNLSVISPPTLKRAISFPAVVAFRKVRWNRFGMGKRGGVRVIYYYHDESMPVFLLTVYPKSRQENLSSAELKMIRKVVSILRRSYGKD